MVRLSNQALLQAQACVDRLGLAAKLRQAVRLDAPHTQSRPAASKAPAPVVTGYAQLKQVAWSVLQENVMKQDNVSAPQRHEVDNPALISEPFRADVMLAVCWL